MTPMVTRLVRFEPLGRYWIKKTFRPAGVTFRAKPVSSSSQR